MNPPAEPNTPPIAWDESNVHSLVFPNFCNVTSSDRDMTMLLGTGHPAKSAEEPMVVEVRDRITLLPIAAKLLGNLIQQTVATYEAQHGPIGNGFQPIPGSDALPNTRRSLLRREELSERGQLLGELIHSLNVSANVERSIKLLPGAVLHERFLLSLDVANLTPSARTRLPIICKRLRMPDSFLKAFEAGLASAHSLHFGFEGHGVSGTYKAYLEPDGAAQEAVREGRPGPVALYTGFKWNPDAPEKQATSEYTAHPGLDAAAIQGRAAELLAGETNQPLREILAEIIAIAATRTEARNLLFVEVTEAGNPRASFDLNLYPAELEFAELYALLHKAAGHYEIPSEMIRVHYEPFRREVFGHISGGIDRNGRSFLTFYFGGRQPLS